VQARLAEPSGFFKASQPVQACQSVKEWVGCSRCLGDVLTHRFSAFEVTAVGSGGSFENSSTTSVWPTLLSPEPLDQLVVMNVIPCSKVEAGGFETRPYDWSQGVEPLPSLRRFSAIFVLRGDRWTSWRIPSKIEPPRSSGRPLSRVPRCHLADNPFSPCKVTP
jgi:hypothetical protein